MLHRFGEKQILQLLLDEFQGKKGFQPFKATICDFCFEDIEESQEFYFTEGKRKFCANCHADLIDYLDGRLLEL